MRQKLPAPSGSFGRGVCGVQGGGAGELGVGLSRPGLPPVDLPELEVESGLVWINGGCFFELALSAGQVVSPKKKAAELLVDFRVCGRN